MFERSLRIGSLAGIEVRLHWTILLGFLYFYLSVQPEDLTGLILLIALVVSLFICVTLHELGHALAARRYGIATQRIVLWLFGGLALLEREPNRPRHELVIAAAGPLVNVAIAGGLAIIGGALYLYDPAWDVLLAMQFNMAEWPFYLVGIGQALIRMNLVLALFNLIPIYPLDGGRMLRAIVAMGLGQERANRILFIIGLPLAVGLMLYFLVRGEWLSVLISTLLIAVVFRLNPKLTQQMSLIYARVANRPDYYFMRGEYVQAVEAYTAMIARQPNNLRAYHNRAASYHQLRDYSRALNDYNRVIAATPQHVKALYDRASLHLDHQKYDLALADMNQVIALDPNRAEWYVQRGIIYRRAGDREAAEHDLEQAEARNSELAWAQNVRGILLLDDNDLAGAEAAFSHAIERFPETGFVWSNRGLVRMMRGDHTSALADLEQAITHDPKLQSPVMLRGVMAMRDGDIQAAIEFLDRASALEPNDPEIAWHHARAYYYSGDHRRAQALIDTAVARNPEEACVHSRFWLSYFVMGDLPWALYYYDYVIARRPELAVAYQGRADALRVNNKPSDALADYDRALAIDPERSSAYLGRAMAAAALGGTYSADAERALRYAATPDERRAAQQMLEG